LVGADGQGAVFAAGPELLPMPGEVFTVKGHWAFLMLPAQVPLQHALPWVW
jgi:hypothetical protein